MNLTNTPVPVETKRSTALKSRIRLNEIFQSAIISIVVIAVYYYWFGIADRRSIFLYEHLGFGPFDSITIGRYWMTGLVLSSFITLFYIIINFLIAKALLLFKKEYNIPSWKKVWLMCLPAVIAGIPLIVMNVNSPVMPFSIAIACVFAASAGLAIGLYSAEIFLINTKRFFIISLDGFALVPPLILFLALGLPSKGILKMTVAIAISLGSVIFSLGWLIIITFLYKWKSITPAKGYEILISGLFFSYLVLPMVHYLFSTPPGNPYITSSDNFFPDSFYLKILTWVTVLLIIFLASRFRTKFLSLKHNIALNSNS